jgi:hypothetical protein
VPLQRPVNDRQLQVLRRIVDGQKPVSSSEPALATTAYALRARGLIETKRSDGGWTAVPTDLGIFYLQHERYPVRQAVSVAPKRPTIHRPRTRPATRATVENTARSPRSWLPR